MALTMKMIFVSVLAVLTMSQAAHAEQLNRPAHINEQFFHPLTETTFHYRDHRAYEKCRGSSEVWRKILLGMKFASAQADCPTTAIAILEQIRKKLGKDHPYQKIWIENQQLVFNHDESVPPIQPAGDSLPDRAMSDYEYQLASWHFYRHAYDKALPLYQKIASELHAPMRPYAAYMVARVFYYQGKGAEAAVQINAILADDSLRAIHGQAANYRFIMLWQDRNVTYDYDAALMEDFLEWLLQVVAVSPEKSLDIEQSFDDFFDAQWHLNHYFPLYDRESKTVDWWLREDVQPDSPRMQAVKALAPTNETVDWLQSHWALNIFEGDWLWALHGADAPYWAQNRHIVNHAWKRWQAGDGLEWLEIVISRVHPDDPIAEEALKAAEPYFTREWKTESGEYRLWLANLWEHTLRLHLGRKDYERARKLMSEHQDNLTLRPNGPYGDDPRYTETLENILRWLVYTGEWNEARAMLPVILKQYPKGFTTWRTLLANDWNEAMASAYTNGWGYGGEFASNSDLWQHMVNFLPAEKLFALAQDEKIDAKMRAELANAALARAMLLERHDKVKEYTALSAKLNPALRERILSEVEGLDRDGYVDLMLRVPRLRPVPFAMLWQYSREELAPTAIDVFNHNDNNWWCRYDAKALNRKLDDLAFVTLETNRRNYETRWVFRGVSDMIPDIEKSVQISEAPYLKKQKEQLAKHPFQALVDQKELEALVATPSGPQYLSEAVIRREKWNRWMIWRSEAAKNKSASDLHHAVRTTRYGCEQNGSHAAYSQGAFKILHQNYGDTVWARATPYWFK